MFKSKNSFLFGKRFLLEPRLCICDTDFVFSPGQFIVAGKEESFRMVQVRHVNYTCQRSFDITDVVRF